MFVSSVPGESPPLPRNTPGTVSDIRHDVVKTRAMVSEVHRDVVDTHTMVSNIYRNTLNSQGGADDQHRSVSDMCTLFRDRMNNRSPFPRLEPGQ